VAWCRCCLRPYPASEFGVLAMADVAAHMSSAHGSVSRKSAACGLAGWTVLPVCLAWHCRRSSGRGWCSAEDIMMGLVCRLKELCKELARGRCAAGWFCVLNWGIKGEVLCSSQWCAAVVCAWLFSGEVGEVCRADVGQTDEWVDARRLLLA
jgi:hypothetical protein